VILHNGTFEKTNGYCTDVFFQQALRWMDSVRGRQPFFCYIATNAPHAPLQVRTEDEARYAGKTPSANAAKFFGMIANIDDNVGRLLQKLADWNLDKETLVVFMNDNGGTVGVPVFNAGMRGQKVTPWLGGTRAASFWRWPGTLKPADVAALCGHIDFFPTIAELAGVPMSRQISAQVEGRSLTPLLENPRAAWPDRTLFTHVGRWPKGVKPDLYKYRECSVRTPRWHLVSTNNKTNQKAWQLFDVKADPGEQRNVAAQFPDVVSKLDDEYDRWWSSVQPQLINEDAVGPPVNPFKTLYLRHFSK
jgi:arylsulfatase